MQQCTGIGSDLLGCPRTSIGGLRQRFSVHGCVPGVCLFCQPQLGAMWVLKTSSACMACFRFVFLIFPSLHGGGVSR